MLALPGRSFLGGDESSFDDSLGHGTFAWAGGIVGFASITDITRCLFIGSVSGKSISGGVEGTSYAGTAQLRPWHLHHLR